MNTKHTLFLGALITAIMVTIGSLLLFGQQSSTTVQRPASQNTPATSTISSGSDVKMVGTIQAIKNEQPYDGPLSIEVNNVWIIVGGGEMPPNAQNGSLIGLDMNDIQRSVGKKVEVFAAKINPQYSGLTILGDSTYYVKAIP